MVAVRCEIEPMALANEDLPKLFSGI